MTRKQIKSELRAALSVALLLGAVGCDDDYGGTPVPEVPNGEPVSYSAAQPASSIRPPIASSCHPFFFFCLFLPPHTRASTPSHFLL